MTPDELRKRCAECSGDIAWELVNTGNTTKLESLCREMIVEGLERAAGMCELMSMSTTHNLAVSIRKVAAEAQQVKEWIWTG